MLPKASSASLYDRPDSGRFLLPGLLEDTCVLTAVRTGMRDVRDENGIPTTCVVDGRISAVVVLF